MSFYGYFKHHETAANMLKKRIHPFKTTKDCYKSDKISRYKVLNCAVSVFIIKYFLRR